MTYDISHLIPLWYKEEEIPQKEACEHIYSFYQDYDVSSLVEVSVKFGDGWEPKDKDDVCEVFNFCPRCGVKFIHE